MHVGTVPIQPQNKQPHGDKHAEPQEPSTSETQKKTNSRSGTTRHVLTPVHEAGKHAIMSISRNTFGGPLSVLSLSLVSLTRWEVVAVPRIPTFSSFSFPPLPSSLFSRGPNPFERQERGTQEEKKAWRGVGIVRETSPRHKRKHGVTNWGVCPLKAFAHQFDTPSFFVSCFVHRTAAANRKHGITNWGLSFDCFHPPNGYSFCFSFVHDATVTNQKHDVTNWGVCPLKASPPPISF